MSFLIRRAETIDLPVVLELLEELAIIKKQEKEFDLTIYDLIRDGFSLNPSFYLYVAEFDKNVIGFLMYSRTYSIKGRSLFLDDIYVGKQYKNLGIGLSMFSKFLEFSKNENAKRLEWNIILNFKNLVALHENAGAEVLYNMHVYELGEKEIKSKTLEDNKIKQNNGKDIYKIRKGRMEDMSGVLECMKGFAQYQNTTCDIAISDLIKDGFSEKPYFNTFVSIKDGVVVGVLLFFENYSTIKGKALIIEDLFVKPEYRKMGISKALSFALYKYAIENKFKHVSQIICDWDTHSMKLCEYDFAKIAEGVKRVRISQQALKKFINTK